MEKVQQRQSLCQQSLDLMQQVKLVFGEVLHMYRQLDIVLMLLLVLGSCVHYSSSLICNPFDI